MKMKIRIKRHRKGGGVKIEQTLIDTVTFSETIIQALIHIHGSESKRDGDYLYPVPSTLNSAVFETEWEREGRCNEEDRGLDEDS